MWGTVYMSLTDARAAFGVVPATSFFGRVLASTPF